MSGFNRRTLLAALGVSASVLAAGCNGQQDSEASLQGAESVEYAGVYRATSVDRLPEPDQRPALAVTGDGLYEWLSEKDGWRILPVGGSESIPVSYFPGDTLAEQFRNAVSAASGRSAQFSVGPRPDGEPHQWADDVVIDPLNHAGVRLTVGAGVEIEYTGDGWPLTIDSNGTHQSDEHRVSIEGGVWRATGDPDGWLRLKDVILANVEPEQVTFDRGSNDECTLVSVENHDLYSEANRLHINGAAPIGIDFKPASVTGGDGSDSFHDTFLDRCHLNVSNIGIRFRGNWQYGTCLNCAVFLTAAGGDGLVFDAPRMDGTVIGAQKVESPPKPGEVTAVVTKSGYDGFYGPLLLGGWYDGYGITRVSRDDSGKTPTLLQLTQNRNALGMRNLQDGATSRFNPSGRTTIAGDLTLSGGFEADQPLRYPVLDLRTVDDVSCGAVAYHNGDGGYPEGPAFYDGTDWQSQVDGSRIS